MDERCIREKKRTVLVLNKVETFSVNDSENEIYKKLKSLKSKVDLMYYNISSRFNGKFIFINPDSPSGPYQIVTGKDSFSQIPNEFYQYLQLYKINATVFLRKVASHSVKEKLGKIVNFTQRVEEEFLKKVPKVPKK